MKRPIHTQKPGPGSSHAGWRQPLGDLWTQFLAELHSLKARAEAEMSGPIGVPAAYQGVRVFKPEPSVTSDGLFHVVVRDGQTYDIPIYFPGPGVFVARSMEVNVYQRYPWVDVGGSGFPPQDFYLLARQFSTALAADATEDGTLRTLRLSVLPPPMGAGGYPSPDQVEEPVPALQFFWNLLDSKNGRYLADNLMPQQLLQPMTAPRIVPPVGFATEVLLAYPIDGGRFYFDAPWLVERDGQMRFQFRPTTAMVQLVEEYDAGRMQDVHVQVELYGERYETLQDAVRSGAMTRPVRGEEE